MSRWKQTELLINASKSNNSEDISNKQIDEMAFNLIMATSPLGVKDLTKQFDYNTVAKDLYELYGWRKQSEWISVDERLPHWSDGKVLVFTKYGFSICERTVNGRWKGQYANWITHWMPLPEAPKMKGGAE